MWCQEEPKNMGAWFFVQNWLEECFRLADMKNVSRPSYIGRPPSASPATGLNKTHVKEQDILCRKALTGTPADAMNRENY
jgi:2-oxoglutarate dehydrogenase E1 component